MEETQKDLPLPQTDLPLPEKEIPEHVVTPPSAPTSGAPKSKLIMLGIVIVLFLAIVAGAYVFGKNNATPKPTETIVESTPTPTPDPTANWKTYDSDGVKFNYPSDWTITTDPNGNVKNVSLMSPSGDFKLYLDNYDLKMQINKFTCATCKYTVLSSINPAGNSGAYIVINSSLTNSEPIQELSISGTKSYDSSQGWPYIATPNNADKLIRWSGEFIDFKNCPVGDGCKLVSMSLDEFKNKPEVQIAEQILSTFKFTDSSAVDTSTWKTYTNPISTAAILYPPTWTVKESHELSNRTVDDPKEINTAIISGKEGQVKVQWGPMGFGGGCDEQDHKTLKIKNTTVNICINEESGKKYWSFISNGAKDDKITEVNATSSETIDLNDQLVETILSTLTLTK